MKRFQIIVIGSGFAGSLTAMIAQRLGFSTALIERRKHPRFAIGESSTPLANLLLEEISDTYDLPFIRPLSKWGTWQQRFPQIACGLKRGFTFYHHEFRKPFADPDLKRQLLVGASATESVADTHWYRPDFDHYLVQKAQEIGVTYFDQTNLTEISEHADGITLRGPSTEFSADFIIDSTGQRGFLHRTLNLPEKQFPLLPPTQTLFTHFTDVGSFEVSSNTPPYPPEQAAVHHIFPGGWIWILRFNNGITSAGVGATDEVANRLRFQSGEAGWQRLLNELPSIREIFASSRATMPFVHQPRLSFQSAITHGPRWLMLPSAAGFVDPLLSTGFPLTLLGILRVGSLLATQPTSKSLQKYSEVTALELETTSILIAALYASMDRFELFKQLSLLYFAAAHYSETMRRQGKADLVKSFLFSDNPIFSNQLRHICREAVQRSTPEQILVEKIRAAIKPFDLIGFTDPSHGPWYKAV